MERLKAEVTLSESGMRLDVYCVQIFNPILESQKGFVLSREHVKQILQNGGVMVSGQIRKPGYKVSEGEAVEVFLPDPVAYSLEPENIPLDILYEDQDLIVVNKPKGMVVHPAPGNASGTLVNALLYHTKDLSGINGVYRPGIVHRIDKNTTGLLMVAKNDLAHHSLSEQLKNHTIHREYIGLCKGRIKADQGTIDKPIGRNPKDRLKRAVIEKGGKAAITHFKVLDRFRQDYTLAAFKLETGRTHQIRVHMASIGYPLVGDGLYSGNRHHPFKTEGQCLHAAKLGFVHPRTGETLNFSAPLPEYFQDIIDRRLERI